MTRRAQADRLAGLLDSARVTAEGEEQGGVATADPDEQALLLLASALGEVAPSVEPMRPEFRSDLRAQLVQAARENAPEAPFMTRLRDRVQRMRYSTGVATGGSIAAVALSGGGVAAAAESAQPGELLYPVKIAIEDVRLGLTGDDLAAGERAVSYAFDRLDEAAIAAAEQDDAAAATALEGAAERMVEATDRIVDAGLVDPLLRLADSVAEQQAFVDGLLPMLEAEGSVAANGLSEVLAETRDAIAEAVGRDVLDPSDVPDLLPDASTTATPVPEVSTPPVDVDPVPGSDLDVDGGEGLPDVQLPDVQVPDVQLPDLQVPDVQVPDVQVPGGISTPTRPATPDPDQVVPDAGAVEQPLEDAVEGVGATVDGVVEDAVEQVIEPVAPDVAETVGTVVDGAVGAVGGAVGSVDAGVGDTLGTVDDSVDDAVDDVGDVTSGVLGGG